MPVSSAPWNTPSRHTRWLLATLLLTLAWDWLGADLAVMRWIGTAQGFPLRNSWLLETVLHDRLRQLGVVLYLLVWIWALWPRRLSPAGWHWLQLPRRERIWVSVLIALALLAINLVKRGSATSCPWSLSEFGGVATYVPHWDLWRQDGGPGHCFPGGHASSAFAFLALALPWLEPVRRKQRPSRRAVWAMAGMVMAGGGLGVVQTLRGAHYPSHTLWTLVVCWGVAWLGWRLARPWLARGARPGPRVTSPRPA